MKFSHSLAYTFGKLPKCEIEKNDRLITPGVGSYHPKNNGKSGPKWKFGTEIRVKKKDNGVPGPNHYKPKKNLTIKASPKYSFSSKAGDTNTTGINGVYSPGPGTYTPVLKSTAPKYSMRSKNSFTFKNENPGPATYDVKRDITVKTLPSYKFSRTEKKGPEIDAMKTTPAPGAYDVSDNLLTQSQPMYSFGKELRSGAKRDTTPDPGRYKTKEYFGKEGPKISMSKKLVPCKTEIWYNPGPGAYKQTKVENYMKKSPSFGFGTTTRDNFYRASETPGPGEYSIESSHTLDSIKVKNPSWVMGTDKKGDWYINRDLTIPGVGKYNLRKRPGAETPKYSMGAKNPSLLRTSSDLGPGQYNTIDPNLTFTKAPSWKVGTGSRDDKLRAIIREDIPGPGKYTPNLKNRKSAPSIKFGTGIRTDNYANDTPGPGQYHIPYSISDVNDYIRYQGNFDENFRYI